MNPPDRALAFAPASVGNVAVGFDVLGYSAPFTGDRVRAARTAAGDVRIAGISGIVVDLPLRSSGGLRCALNVSIVFGMITSQARCRRRVQPPSGWASSDRPIDARGIRHIFGVIHSRTRSDRAVHVGAALAPDTEQSVRDGRLTWLSE